MDLSEPAGKHQNLNNASGYPQPFSATLGEQRHNRIPPSSGLIYRHAYVAVLWAMAFNFLLALFKLGVALFIDKSAALFSEGLHSLVDGINSIFLLFGITRGHKAPDRTHPFGYGLEANVWALFASFLLFISAAWAIAEGASRFYNPHPIYDYIWAIVILFISSVVEFFAVMTASRAVLEELGLEAEGLGVIPKAMRHIREVVGPTTRFVFYEDSLAFLGAFIAFIAISLTKLCVDFRLLDSYFLQWPDALASMAIGLLLLFLGLNLLRYNSGFLTGAAAPLVVEKRIRELVKTVHGVSEVYDLKTIDHGLSGLMVQMAVEVDPDIQVKDVDDLTERIKTRLQERMPNIRQVIIEVLADETEIQWIEKFDQLIAQGRAEGLLNAREETMLRNLYDFREAVARDVMVPRMDVEYVDIETPLEEVADLMIESGHSRLPVYEEHVDNIVGMIRGRDVFYYLRRNQLDVPLRTLLREIDIYPENKPVSDLLEDFKRKKIQMAVVADEHGGFAGVLTIEDLLEEIVGEIWDEHDIEEPMLEFLDEYRVLVSGKYSIDDLNEQFNLTIPSDEFKTIGGYVFGLLGREPEQGDHVVFEDLIFTVTEADGARIVTVMIEAPFPLKRENPETVEEHPGA